MRRWNYHSNVADVLSLGPRTAGRLLQLGVRTADELLQARPQALALRLCDEHFTAEVLAAWQRETQLLLELPELESETARVLAALGFAKAETIARTTPTELLIAWESALREQGRNHWLHSAGQPSVREVNSWIQLAQQASAQRAA